MKVTWLGTSNAAFGTLGSPEGYREIGRPREISRKKWGTAGFKYSSRKMEVAAQVRAGWRQVVCGLCSTGSEKQYVEIGLNHRHGWSQLVLLENK